LYIVATRCTAGIGPQTQTLAGKTLLGGATIEITLLLAGKFFAARGAVL
jgi:hypothetical protein